MIFGMRRISAIDAISAIGNLFSALDQAERFFTNIPLLWGKSISYSVSAVGNNTIKHGLRRVPKGWIVTGQKGGDSDFYEVSRDDTDLILYFNSYPTTVEFWIY
jgi:hypothetical protein